MSVIARLEWSSDSMSVWLDGHTEPTVVSWMWAQDHSRDPASFDAATQQREVDTFSIDPTLVPTDVVLIDGVIEITWPDGSPRTLLPPAAFGAPDRVIDRIAWRTPEDVAIEAVPFDAVVDTDDGLARWVGDIGRYGFGLVSGAPPGEGPARQLAERIGYVRRTIFGDMWTLSSEVVAHADSAYGAATLEPHTDGSYSHDGPGTQLFVCEQRTGAGGESVLVDGLAAAESLRASDPAAFDLLARVSVPSHYVEDGVELRASRPTIRLAGDGEVEQVTFNNYDRSPFVLPPKQMADWYEAYRAFHELVIDRASWWTHRLEPGDGLFFDNWRCLHGRLAYSGIRVFHGCYLNHEDLESRQRVLFGHGS